MSYRNVVSLLVMAVKAIRVYCSELPDPKNIKELRYLLGTLNFVRRFVPEYIC